MAQHQSIEQIAALRALACSQPLPSNNRPPMTAPAAFAPRSILYDRSCLSWAKSWANSGIWAWKALRARNDEAPPSITIDRIVRFDDASDANLTGAFKVSRRALR